jgi:Flp pilus assembly protein TadD
MRALRLVTLALALAAAAPGAVPAMESDTSAPRQGDDYDKAVKAVKAQKFKDAVELLQKVVGKEPKKADAWNYLGYSQRRLGEADKARAAYAHALELDAKHKGAHEYAGELALESGDLATAEGHLAQLVQVCPRGCEERKELEKAMTAYKKAKGIM